MIDFAFFLKTYRNDKKRVDRLIMTFNKYNVENLKLFLVCPEEDIKLFNELKSDTIEIIAEEKINTCIFEQDEHWTKGYLNQEIYKLAFWELNLCENYQCIDSDAIFIRSFYKKDFMYDAETPYTILLEDNDLRADLYYNKLYWNGRMEWMEKIMDALDYHPYKMMTCHGFQTFSSKVLKDFKRNFLQPNNYSYRDIIRIAPFEFSWYNFWLQKTECMPIRLCEPNFKTFHLKQHHINEVLRGMTIEDWAKGYIGIIVNSNYGVGEGDYNDLSVYDAGNAELDERSVERSAKFYMSILKGQRKNLVKRIVNKIKNEVRLIWKR